MKYNNVKQEKIGGTKEMLIKMKKNMTGITLIALIITIVILIILAGVTIAVALRGKWNTPKSKRCNR